MRADCDASQHHPPLDHHDRVAADPDRVGGVAADVETAFAADAGALGDDDGIAPVPFAVHPAGEGRVERAAKPIQPGTPPGLYSDAAELRNGRSRKSAPTTLPRPGSGNVVSQMTRMLPLLRTTAFGSPSANLAEVTRR